MRLGGHETFSIREGWLHKGLKMLVETPDRLSHEHVADFLGVGRNMGKSIKHWLIATGLGATPVGQRVTKSTPMGPTELGSLVWANDPYFLEEGTWWTLHSNLVTTPTHAFTWNWFFNSFHLERFDRHVCIESLSRHLQMNGGRIPSRRTLERDVACFLSSYARTIPELKADPEESLDSPFRDLGLMTHYRSSGYYHVHQENKEIPREIFGYALALAFEDARGEDGKTDIPVFQAAQQTNAPGRVFALSSETLFEVALRIEGEAPSGDIQIAGHAGERVLRIARKRPIDWLSAHYARLERDSSNAA